MPLQMFAGQTRPEALMVGSGPAPQLGHVRGLEARAAAERWRGHELALFVQHGLNVFWLHRGPPKVSAPARIAQVSRYNIPSSLSG